MHPPWFGDSSYIITKGIAIEMCEICLVCVVMRETPCVVWYCVFFFISVYDIVSCSLTMCVHKRPNSCVCISIVQRETLYLRSINELLTNYYNLFYVTIYHLVTSYWYPQEAVPSVFCFRKSRTYRVCAAWHALKGVHQKSCAYRVEL